MDPWRLTSDPPGSASADHSPRPNLSCRSALPSGPLSRAAVAHLVTAFELSVGSSLASLGSRLDATLFRERRGRDGARRGGVRPSRRARPGIQPRLARARDKRRAVSRTHRMRAGPWRRSRGARRSVCRSSSCRRGDRRTGPAPRRGLRVVCGRRPIRVHSSRGSRSSTCRRRDTLERSSTGAAYALLELRGCRRRRRPSRRGAKPRSGSMRRPRPRGLSLR